MKHLPLLILLLFFSLETSLRGKTYHLQGDTPLYQKFLNPDFPFFECTVDFRKRGPEGIKNNLVPRGVVLALGENTYVCFDTELLRVAGIWQGDALSPDSVAMRSYAKPRKKQQQGQRKLPTPQGHTYATTGLYPGWQRNFPVKSNDPRPQGLDEKELGRGPLPSEEGTWIGIEDKGDSAVLHYSVFGSRVKEHFRLDPSKKEPAVIRTIEIAPLEQQVTLILSDQGVSASPRFNTTTLPQNESAQTLSFSYPLSEEPPQQINSGNTDFSSLKKTTVHWPDHIETTFSRGTQSGAYALDELTIPYPNPWKRRIRPYAIDFFNNGDAVIVTFDGDAYRLTGLASKDAPIRWTRIAAGLFEPSSIRIRNEEIFVFSRLGIIKLVDQNDDGETDFYQLVSNQFLQSAETRDMPLSLTPWKDNSWIITKGGQQSSHHSPDSGRVLQARGDGKPRSYWAYGLRNGFINSIPERELLVASDQQGNWVPATPFHIVRQDSFLGYGLGKPLSGELETQEPALWFPHRVARSGIDAVWGNDERMGPLHQKILYLDYTNPSLHKVFLPEETPLIQTAAVPLGIKPQTPILKGAVNPADGQAYLVGFQIWDSAAERLEGLVRLRIQEEDDGLPSNAQVFKEGLLLEFDHPIEESKSQDPANYQINAWNYQRSEKYGSAQYKSDGSPGVDELRLHQVLIAPDHKSLFLVIKDLAPVMQIEAQYLFGDSWQPVYFTANTLPSASSSHTPFAKSNFAKIFSQEPLPRSSIEKSNIVSALRGQQVATAYACTACHSTDGTTEGKSGPSWKGIYQKKHRLKGGETVLVDEIYLKESILEPNKKMAPGYDGNEAGMPSYQGVLDEAEIESLILYIKNLK